MSSFDGFWDNLTTMGDGRDDLMLGPDGQIARKKQHDAAIMSAAEATVPGVTRSVGRPKPDPTKAGTVGAQVGLERLGSMLTSAAPGAVIGTLGAPGDIIGFFKGLYDAATAEEGEGIDAFLTGMTEVSESIGSELGLKYIRDNIDMLPIRDDLKKAIIDGADIGSLFGLGGALTAGGKAIYQGGKRMMSGPATVTKVDAAADSLEPIIIENPEAGPLDRSQLPGKMGRPESMLDIDELGFYSKAQRAAAELKQEKATGKQFLGMLKKSGVSDTEIKAMGLDSSLNTDTVMTKDDLIEIIEQRRPQVTEQKRTSQPAQEEYKGLRFSAPERVEPTEDDVREMMVANDIDEDLARQRLAEEFDEIVVRGLDENYELRGNDDYGYAAYYNDEVISEGNLDFNEARIQAVEHHAQRRQQITQTDSVFDEYRLDGGEDYQELVFENPDSPVGFDRSHWKGQAPNYVAHARTTTRIDDQGRKILFVEEIQSDLNKEIRDIQKTINNITENFDEDFILRPEASLVRKLPDDLVQDLKDYHQATTAKDTDNSFAPVNVSLRDLRIRLEEALDMDLNDEAYQVIKAIGQGKDVWAVKLEHPGKIEIFTDPKTFGSARQAAKLTLDEGSAQVAKLKQEPFADTERYTQMVLRRLINKAVDEGYDGIGFTPGKFQASQYGKEEGQIEFYDRILPRQVNKVTKKIDKDIKIDTTRIGELESYYDLETASDMGMPDYNLPYLDLTGVGKQKVSEEGLPIMQTLIGGAAASQVVPQKEQEDD